MKNFVNLLKQYPDLSRPSVSISDLEVSHRVFFNWKEKGIIDYEHHFTPEDIANKVTRKKIELNAFEALWILIVKEMRSFNVGLDTISELKSFLFTVPDYGFIKSLSKEDINEIATIGLPKDASSILNALDVDIPNLVDYVQNGPTLNKIYFSPIGTLINAILLSGQSPSVFIFKKPSESGLNFEIFNPDLESQYYGQNDQDYRTDLVQGMVEHSVINIPIRPLFEQFFDNRSLLKRSKDFGLFTSSELKILKILKSRDFDKIIIHNNNDEQITVESTASEQVFGQKAMELRKTLGLKEFKRVEVVLRNHKNLVITNTTKEKVDLGKT